MLTFSPFLGVGAMLSIGRMVVEGVEARATTEDEETRCGEASLVAEADGDERRAAVAARGTTAAALLLLDAPRHEATEEAPREEDASVDCILF